MITLKHNYTARRHPFVTDYLIYSVIPPLAKKLAAEYNFDYNNIYRLEYTSKFCKIYLNNTSKPDFLIKFI